MEKRLFCRNWICITQIGPDLFRPHVTDKGTTREKKVIVTQQQRCWRLGRFSFDKCFCHINPKKFADGTMRKSHGVRRSIDHFHYGRVIMYNELEMVPPFLVTLLLLFTFAVVLLTLGLWRLFDGCIFPISVLFYTGCYVTLTQGHRNFSWNVTNKTSSRSRAHLIDVSQWHRNSAKSSLHLRVFNATDQSIWSVHSEH